MRYGKIVFGAVLLTALAWRFGTAEFAFENEWQQISAGNSDFTAVACTGSQPGILYAGSKSSLMRSQDMGSSWRPVLILKGQPGRLSRLVPDPCGKNALFAGTGQGLYQSEDAGLHWKKIFQGKGWQENRICALAVSDAVMYLGTGAGLFVSYDRGRSWQKASGKLAAPIAAVAVCAQDPSLAWAVSADGVFKTQDRGNSWQRVFTALAKTPEEEGDAQEASPEDGQATGSGILYDICVDPANSRLLYLATARGAYQSLDAGSSWSAMTAHGLIDRQIRQIRVSAQSQVYAVCRSTVFAYRDQRWEALPLGPGSRQIRDMSFDAQGRVYVACDSGLFTLRYTPSEQSFGASSRMIMPTIRSVQEAAVEYAEVGNGKIKQWRKQASRKAWLPTVSLGVDRNATDLWHWESGSTTKAEDDMLRKGHDSVEWDIRLSWELGNLIWNSDQASIDVRSRLMVELRDSILDEVTKLYFEYRRVTMELDGLRLEDKRKRQEKELRLQELSASLDALTGGYFSSRVPKG